MPRLTITDIDTYLAAPARQNVALLTVDATGCDRPALCDRLVQSAREVSNIPGDVRDWLLRGCERDVVGALLHAAPRHGARTVLELTW